MARDDGSIEINLFERVDAAPGLVLLRAAIRPGDLAPPALLVYAGRTVHRLLPLPSPPDRNGELRVAYSAPSSVVQHRGASFALEFPVGTTIDLPIPSRRRLAEPPPVRDLEAELAEARAEAERYKREAAKLESKLRREPPAAAPRVHGKHRLPSGPLARLACDPKIVNGSAPPRFPYALLRWDVQLDAAIEQGDQREIATTSDLLRAGIERLLESDSLRLDGIGDALKQRQERDFLQNRRRVLEARLSELGPE